MVYAHMPNFVSIINYRPLLAKNSNFCRFFWTSAFSVVASWQQSDKVEHGYTTINTFPYPTVSKSFLYFNAFTLAFKSVTNKETIRQTKKLNVFGCPGGG